MVRRNWDNGVAVSSSSWQWQLAACPELVEGVAVENEKSAFEIQNSKFITRHSPNQ